MDQYQLTGQVTIKRKSRNIKIPDQARDLEGIELVR